MFAFIVVTMQENTSAVSLVARLLFIQSGSGGRIVARDLQ